MGVDIAEFVFVGNYVFGVMACLVIAKTIKLFTATPRPYFMSICQPNVTFCVEATEAICTNTNVTELNDARWVDQPRIFIWEALKSDYIWDSAVIQIGCLIVEPHLIS